MERGHEVVIRYTDRLEEFGITNDKELGEWSAKEELFDWVNNSWFVVLHDTDTEWYSEPFHELDVAIEVAEKAKLAPEKYLAGVWA
jgi:tryptophan 2,3-dioxygenase